LTADNDVNKLILLPTVQAQITCRTNKDICFTRSVGRDYHVGKIFEALIRFSVRLFRTAE
jgi:hypothetical protein